MEDQAPEPVSDGVENDQKACDGIQMTGCLSSRHSDPTFERRVKYRKTEIRMW